MALNWESFTPPQTWRRAGAEWADVAGEVAAERAAIQWEGADDA